MLLCIRSAHDTMDFPYRDETSHCHSRRMSRSCRCYRDAGLYPARRYPDDEAPGAVTGRPRRRSSARRASPEVAIEAGVLRASRSRASVIFILFLFFTLRNSHTSLQFRNYFYTEQNIILLSMSRKLISLFSFCFK